MAGASAPAAPAYSNAQLFNMPWASRSKVLPKLTPAQRASYHSFVNTNNVAYMKLCVPQWAPVPYSGGGFTPAIAAGTQYTFNVNTASNAMVEGFFIRAIFTLNPATGTAAAYAKNAGAPLNVIDNIQIVYGNVVQNFRPYILRTLAMMGGKTAPPTPSTVLIGQSVATVGTYVNGGQAITVNTNNVWDFDLYVSLAPIRRNDWFGLLPGMGGETQLQVQITTATSFQVGADPEYNVVSAVSGTGHAIVVAGTLAVIARYRDGTTRRSPVLRRLEVAGEASVHFLRDQTLMNITAGTVFSGTIGIKSSEIPWVLLTLIDGQSSTKFSSWANTAILQETADAVGNNIIWKTGTGTNMSQYLVPYDLERRIFEQDLDEGIVPIVKAPVSNVNDPDNMDGQDFLNTLPSGYPDWHYGVQFTAVGGVAGIVPRVATHVIAKGAALRTA